MKPTRPPMTPNRICCFAETADNLLLPDSACMCDLRSKPAIPQSACKVRVLGSAVLQKYLARYWFHINVDILRDCVDMIWVITLTFFFGPPIWKSRDMLNGVSYNGTKRYSYLSWPPSLCIVWENGGDWQHVKPRLCSEIHFGLLLRGATEPAIWLVSMPTHKATSQSKVSHHSTSRLHLMRRITAHIILVDSKYRSIGIRTTSLSLIFGRLWNSACLQPSAFSEIAKLYSTSLPTLLSFKAYTCCLSVLFKA